MFPETPERPTGRSGAQHELHREATVGAIDPVTACPTAYMLPTQGGSDLGPATQNAYDGAPKILFTRKVRVAHQLVFLSRSV